MVKNELPLVRNYYANKEIFITGGTGYLGKVLIEKLLRSCPEVKKIYVLIRPKKNLSAEERLRSFLQDFVFHRLRAGNPEALEKIDCCPGDVKEIGLGIDEANFARIRKCSIVIHSAATVRFDEKLKESILMNTRGTQETLLLAQRMDNVEIFNHISTTFCNVGYLHSEEKLYPAQVNWRDAIKVAENLDGETLETIAKHYVVQHPNTYTFSKLLSEHLFNDLRKECQFPILILRPSIVSPTVEEPVPGWVDNFNGPTGIITAVASGILRFYNDRADLVQDYQPVDVVAKSIILSTWKEANSPNDLTQDVSIYNSSSSGKYAVTIADLHNTLDPMRWITPLQQTFWYPNYTYTRFRLWFLLKTIFLVAIPMIILDLIVKVLGLKLRFQLSHLVRKIFYVQKSLRHHLNVVYTFDNSKCIALDKALHSQEYAIFRQESPMRKEQYLQMIIRNGRKYLMKESDSSIPKAQRNMKFFRILHFATLTILYMLAAQLVIALLRRYSQRIIH